ncbi:MAG TPA: hypothetical protein VG649_24290 [Candidatus Angelobacter sp.]|nr:hypothetical protein [Candidatus Angelobacter sp.]
MANLALKYPHSVLLLAENIPGSGRFNCYQYSFGLADVRFRSGILEIFLGRDFAQFLVGNHLEEVDPQGAEDGDYVLYSGSQIKHAGRVQAGAVQTKWGTGHIWRHGVYEVPGYYGDTVRFFRRISGEDVVRRPRLLPGCSNRKVTCPMLKVHFDDRKTLSLVVPTDTLRSHSALSASLWFRSGQIAAE